MSEHHEHWGSKIGFILATAGSAVGLGSLWRFPYIAGDNGGGAFVILYLVFTFLIGLPVMMGELSLGRLTQKSAIEAYGSGHGGTSNWRMLGWLNVITSFIILSYYSVVSGWCLSYCIMSLNNFSAGKSPQEIRDVYTVLSSAPGISVFWLALFLLINAGIIHSGIRKGIEHWSKILMPALFIFLIAIFIYSTTLSGFPKALDFVFTPDFSKLSASGVLVALGMAFFTLSVGLGILVTYGSYMTPTENVPFNSTVIAIMTVAVSLLAAMTIFPIVFTYGFPSEGGPGLVFQTLPVIFAKMPATILISTIFFALLLFAALTSTISLLEVLVANLMELFNFKRGKATTIATVATFILAIPSALSSSSGILGNWKKIYGKSFFDTLDYITTSWMMPFAALFAIIFIGYKMKKSILFESFGASVKARWIIHPWYWSLRIIAPIAIILIILTEAGILDLSTLFNLSS
jgi:neurotransmitter:Na+ symporter, NSS family